jgi:hypothetical protein
MQDHNPLDDEQTLLPVRLAMRVEGKMWNAYFAWRDSMKDAILIGSLTMEIASDPIFEARFASLMSDVVASIIEDAAGVRPDIRVQSAPENEKGGNA